MFDITPIQSSDTLEAGALIAALRADMNGREVCTDQEMQAVLERSLQEPTYQGFIARDTSGEALGYVGVNRRFAIYAGGTFLQITELFVSPKARRSGMATRLLTKAHAYARAVGASCIELGAPGIESHPETHAFYASQGFKVVGPRLSKTV